MVRLKMLMLKHRPSGVVGGFLAFFLISYIIITKLDKTDRVHVGDTLHHTMALPPPAAKVVRTHDAHIIPANILKEFANDEAKDPHTNYDFYDDLGNYTDYTMADLANHVVQYKQQESFKQQVNSYSEQKERNDAWNKKVKTRDKDNKSDKVPNKHHKAKSVYRNMTARLNSKLTSTKNKLINIYNVLDESKKHQNSIKSNKCVLLKTLHGSSPICIHSPHEDEIISGKINAQGNWEANYLYIVGSILSKNPSFGFLDLGCNIGVYTILAAKLGHRVMAVDPNKLNLRLLTKSLNMGGISNKVTLLWNAISNVQENVTLFDIVGNIGGTFVETADEGDIDDDTIDADHRAVAITLNDLVDMFRGEEIFIKIDIETYELKALKGGDKFFSQVNVRYVLMEWIYHREFDTGKEVIKFMKRHNLYPHVNAHKITKLEPENYRSWPDNILWIRY